MEAEDFEENSFEADFDISTFSLDMRSFKAGAHCGMVIVKDETVCTVADFL